MKQLTFLKLIFILSILHNVFLRVEKKNKKFLSKTEASPADYRLEVRTSWEATTFVACRVKVVYENYKYLNLGIPLFNCDNNTNPVSGKTYAMKSGTIQYYIFLWKYLPKKRNLCPMTNNSLIARTGAIVVSRYFYASINSAKCDPGTQNEAFLFTFVNPKNESTDLPEDDFNKYINDLSIRNKDFASRVNAAKTVCTNDGATYAQQKPIADSVDKDYDTQIKAKKKCVSDGNAQNDKLKASAQTTQASISTKQNELSTLVNQKSTKDMSVTQNASMIEKTNAANNDLQAQFNAGTSETANYQTNLDNAKAAFDAVMTNLIETLESEADIATAGKTAITGVSSPDLQTFNTKMALILPIVEAEVVNNNVPSRRRRKF
jgi:hypothetical protein